MVKFDCFDCNYTTNIRTNYLKHLQSIKHSENIEPEEDIIDDKLDVVKEYVCKYCDNTYISLSGFNKHRKNCMQKEELINNLTIEIASLKKDNESLKKDIDNYKNIITIKDENIQSKDKEIEYLRSTVTNAGSVIKSSVNALTYAVTHYNNAPPLVPLLDYTVINNNKNNEDFVKDILYNYNKDLIDQHLGDQIVKIYKKADPEQQSFWNSDVNRLSYLIRAIINNKSDWFVDKKGIRIREQIIDPMLQYIKTILQTFIQDMSNKINEAENGNELMSMMDNMKYANLVIIDINNNVIANDINKYIASYFVIHKTDTVKLIEAK